MYLLLLPIFSFGKTGTTISEEKVNGWLNKIHWGFIENKGQVEGLDKKPVKEVLFKASIKNVDIYITTSGITYILKKQTIDTASDKSGPEEDEKRPVEWCRMDMKLVNTIISRENIHPELPEQQGYLNYYFPCCPNGILGVNTYDKIVIKNIYFGIDWVIYSTEKGLKYDFIVHPGANPDLIKLSYSGTSEIKTESDGSMLVLKTSLGTIQEGALHCYQGLSSNTVPTKYELTENELRFNVGKYDTHSNLIIDPPVDLLQWSTYYGFDFHMGPRAICTDAAGNIYVTGYTDCSGMPTQDPGGGAFYNGTFSGGSYMAFIVKFSSAGAQQWCTYYGGSNYDIGRALVTDASGNLFVAGYSGSGDLPTKNPGGGAYYQSTLSGGGDFDLFLSKFTPSGVLIWSTYYGGTLDDEARGVDIDPAGNFWVTGFTTSTDFPTLNPGGGAYYQGTYGGPSGFPYGDAFILKFDNNGKQIWGTYYGGSGQEEGYSIKAAKTGDILVTGYTASTDLPTLNPGGGAYYQAANAGGNDLFIAKFTNAGTQLWGTYYGGTADDYSTNDFHTLGSMTIDNTGNIYITGATKSSNFPVLNPGGTTYFQGANAGNVDAFILKFRLSGVPVWATYYGGGSAEEGNSVVTDANGNIYVTGQSLSGTIPTLNPGGGAYYQKNNAASMDIFINEFDSTGTMTWATFFGGNQDDWSGQATVAPSGCLLVTGEWLSTGGITTVNPGGGAYYQPGFSGSHDGYMLEFCPVCSKPSVIVTPPFATQCSADSTKLTASGATGYIWSPAAGLNKTGGAIVIAKPSTTTTYTVIGVTGACSDTQTVVITVNPSPTVTVTPTTSSLCTGDSVSLLAGGATSYTWSPVAGLSCTNCPNPTAKPGSTTTYTVTGTTGSCTDTATVIIIVNPTPTITVTPAISDICNGDSVALTASGATSYTWAPAAGLSCTNCSNPTATPSSTATYTVTGTTGSCTSTKTAIVNVSPSPTITATPATSTICSGDSVALIASGATNYTWAPATGLNCTNCPNPTATPGSTTTYTVTGTKGGCSNIQTVLITVNPTPTVSATPATATMCAGSNGIGLTANGASSYTWKPAVGLTCTSCPNPTANPAVSTTYSVTGTTGSCKDSAIATIIVNPTPTAVVSPDITIIYGDSTIITATGGGTYSWTPITGLSCTNCATTVASPTVTTTYCATIMGADGCTDSACMVVTVELQCGQVFVPNAFSPNKDGFNDILYVRGKCIQALDFIIYDRWGNKVFETTDIANGWDGTYNGQPMNTGTFAYYLSAYTLTKETLTKKGNVTLVR